jgi:glycosyltransferase involved in cell wall biosynthesis
MTLALCMLVKDEVNRIAGCLEPILDLLDQVVIMDTGSSDGTPDLLRRYFGIEPAVGVLDEARCRSRSELRNQTYDLAEMSWILSLDADERVSPDALAHFRNMTHEPDVAGYFGRWVNYLNSEPEFEDYKLFLFRKGFRKYGFVHENVQYDVRRRGSRALWLDDLRVDHIPEDRKRPDKAAHYRRSLECAIRHDPHWYRYHWFLGYTDFRAGRLDTAVAHLRFAAQSNSPLFPVECLNSRMVLTEIEARLGHREEACRQLESALAFYCDVAGDFEVAVNFRLECWLRQALHDCRHGRLDGIRAYRFGC